MIAMVTTEVKRMGHMPHPPLWNAVEIAVSMKSPPKNAWAGLVVGVDVQGQIHATTTRHHCGRSSCAHAFRRSISGRLGAKSYGISGNHSRPVVSIAHAGATSRGLG